MQGEFFTARSHLCRHFPGSVDVGGEFGYGRSSRPLALNHNKPYPMACRARSPIFFEIDRVPYNFLGHQGIELRSRRHVKDDVQIDFLYGHRPPWQQDFHVMHILCY